VTKSALRRTAARKEWRASRRYYKSICLHENFPLQQAEERRGWVEQANGWLRLSCIYMITFNYF
jgi:hypothetical protein